MAKVKEKAVAEAKPAKPREKRKMRKDFADWVSYCEYNVNRMLALAEKWRKRMERPPMSKEERKAKSLRDRIAKLTAELDNIEKAKGQ